MVAALTYPLDLATLADELEIISVKWRPKRIEQRSRMGSGVPLREGLADDVWLADVVCATQPHATALELEALFYAVLDGSFLLYDPRAKLPIADPDAGVSLALASPIIDSIHADNIRIKISGLPANYPLTRGDMLAYDYTANNYRALHKTVSALITADGAGLTDWFEVRPHLPFGAAPGDAVILSKAAAKMELTSIPVPVSKGKFTKHSFSAEQIL